MLLPECKFSCWQKPYQPANLFFADHSLHPKIRKSTLEYPGSLHYPIGSTLGTQIIQRWTSTQTSLVGQVEIASS